VEIYKEGVSLVRFEGVGVQGSIGAQGETGAKGDAGDASSRAVPSISTITSLNTTGNFELYTSVTIGIDEFPHQR